MANENYQRYLERQDALIRDTLDEMECQPIFFIGTGLSKRYFGAPNWIELLKIISAAIGQTEDEFNYVFQRENGEPIRIGTVMESACFEWAWKEREHGRFPKEHYEKGVHRSIFLKHLACEAIRSITPKAADIGGLKLAKEIALFQKTSPHALITTNYDSFLEQIFEGYAPVIGEQVIRSNLNLVGEIFKIHGSMESPETLVITGDDYDNYSDKKKYISAKLLTYLAEHPVFVFGYGFGDSNVNGIIHDVGRIIGDNDKFIRNIFYVQYESEVERLTSFQEEYVIGEGERQYRVRAILANDFSWIYKAIAQEKELHPINTKLLRALAARTYNLIRSDIPRRKVEVDYATLESVADESEMLPKLLGIVASTNANMSHPYVLTQVGRQLGYEGWHGAGSLIVKILKDTGVNLKASDNRYHCAVKSGDRSVTHKYSKELVSLLEKVRDGSPYKVRA